MTTKIKIPHLFIRSWITFSLDRTRLQFVKIIICLLYILYIYYIHVYSHMLFVMLCCFVISRSQDNDEFTRGRTEEANRKSRKTENRTWRTARSVSHSSRWDLRDLTSHALASRADVYKHSTTSPPVGLGRWALSDKAGLDLQAETYANQPVDTYTLMLACNDWHGPFVKVKCDYHYYCYYSVFGRYFTQLCMNCLSPRTLIPPPIRNSYLGIEFH